MTTPILTLYAVRSRDGKYFRAVGYGGYGQSWVDTLERAKIYPRISQAKSRCTWWTRQHPEYGTPEIVELHVTQLVAIDQTARVAKVGASKAVRDAKRAAADKRRRLKEAQAEYDRARDRVTEIARS